MASRWRRASFLRLQEIHLIHHSHTDLGYTDAPEQAINVLTDALREALELAEESGTDEASCFRWTCESLGIVARYLRRFPQEEERLARLIAAGRVEVTALPWNLTAALSAEEWQAMRRVYGPLGKRFGARIAMQCDVNGLPWGMIPGLLADGVETIWFGMNEFAGGSPLPIPSAARWEGPDGSRILVWAGFTYGNAHTWFHERSWRVGPVADAHNVWFHRPGPADVWLASPEGLRDAHARLHARIAEKLRGYPYGVLPLQATNQWRGDSDPPCGHMRAFVAAWNTAGLAPRLVFSTPSRFLERLQREPFFDPPVVRGDWTDWWGDGSPSMPCELAWGQRAKGLLSRLPDLASFLHREAPDVNDAWETAFQSTEHTFGGYDSLVRAWGLRSHAGWCHKAMLFNRSLQRALEAECALLRSAPEYAPVTRAAGIAVAGISSGDAGGWVEIGLQRWPVEPGALRDAAGRIFPLEIEWQQEWAPARADAPALPPGMTGAVWPAHAVRGKAWVPLAAGSSRRLSVVTGTQAEGPRAPAEGRDATWRWRWQDGVLRSLVHLPTGRAVFDEEAPWPFASLIWEDFPATRAWDMVATRDPRLAEIRRLTAPPAEEWSPIPSHYGARWTWRRSHGAWYAAEQELRLPPDGTLELMTRVWMKEHLQPVGLWLSLPLAPADAEPVYDSLGWLTRVGADQLPGSCGEIVGSLRSVGAVSPGLAVSVDCTDTPIVAPGGLYARTGRTALRPARPHWYPCLLASWWATNFPHVRATCIDVRHVLRVGDRWTSAPVLPLVAYPCSSL